MITAYIWDIDHKAANQPLQQIFTPSFFTDGGFPCEHDEQFIEAVMSHMSRYHKVRHIKYLRRLQQVHVFVGIKTCYKRHIAGN